MIMLVWNFAKVGSLDTEIAVLEGLESKIFLAPQPWRGGEGGEGIFLTKS